MVAHERVHTSEMSAVDVIHVYVYAEAEYNSFALLWW